jgi:hypothetical protein
MLSGSHIFVEPLVLILGMIFKNSLVFFFKFLKISQPSYHKN